MMQGNSCQICKHFHAHVLDKNVCDAFPTGIPREIVGGDVSHKKPVKGDHGIRFEPLPEFATQESEE